jgi:membrane fusion protein, heavy metal efflux system
MKFAKLMRSSSAKSLTAVLLSSLVPFSTVSAAGDHSEAAGAAVAAGAALPSFEAANERYEAVGRVQGADLKVWLDDWASNTPVTKATVIMTIGPRKVTLAAAADGTYSAPVPEHDKPATYPITLAISGEGAPALLAGSLTVTDEAAHVDDVGLGAFLPYAAGGALVLVLIGGSLFLMRRRRAALAVSGLALVMGLSATATLKPSHALASEGHDHGGGSEATAPAGDQATRMPDGSINAPKAMQRLIGLRTLVSQSGNEVAAVVLNGLVIADPNASGVVQAQIGGRVSGTLPTLGQEVGKGQALALVTPAFDPSGRASLVESQGQVAQELSLARQRAGRLSAGGATEVDAELAGARSRANGGATAEARAELAGARQNLARLMRLEGVVPARDIENARANVRAIEARIAALQAASSAEVRGLEARRATLVAEANGEARALGVRQSALRVTGNPSETLRAPVGGIISAVSVSQGQVVAPGETLFTIVRPGSMLVEAQATDAASARLGEQASGRTADGRTFSLIRQGIGLSLVNGAAPVRYRVELDAGLRAGEPVTVFAKSAAPVAGVAVPRIAVARGANGQSVVFVKESAERIVIVPVVLAELDAQRVLVTSGLSASQRVVVAGAPLLAQVR